MNAPDNMYLPDVQASADRRNLAIQRVGVKSLAHPVMVATLRGPQPSVATINMYVALPHYQKGTHMSRFLEVLNEQASEPICTQAAHPRSDQSHLRRLNAEEAPLSRTAFTLLLSRSSPPCTKMPRA